MDLWTTIFIYISLSVPNALHSGTIVNKTRKRRRRRAIKKVKDVSEWGVPEWRALLQGKEFTDDDDGARRVITDVVFSHEDDVYYAT